MLLKMGKDNEFLNAIKNGDVSAVRKVLVKFKSGPKGSMAYFVCFSLNVILTFTMYRCKEKGIHEGGFPI